MVLVLLAVTALTERKERKKEAGRRKEGLFTPGPRPGALRLGVVVSQPSAALADQLDLPKGRGLVLEQVVPNSPAAKAGL